MILKYHDSTPLKCLLFYLDNCLVVNSNHRRAQLRRLESNEMEINQFILIIFTKREVLMNHANAALMTSLNFILSTFFIPSEGFSVINKQK